MSLEKQIPSEQTEKGEKKFPSSFFMKALGAEGVYSGYDADGKKNIFINSLELFMHGMTKKELTENDIKPYVEKFTATLEQYLIPDFSKLKDFTLDGIGVLELVFSDGTKKMLDIKPEGRILLSRLALERVKQSNAREALKEEINSESYLGGNIIAVFETITSSTLAPGALAYSTAVAGSTLYHMGRGVYRGGRAVQERFGAETRPTYTRIDYSSEAQNILKKVWYKTPSGSMESVDVSDIGRTPMTREQHSQRIIKMLGQKGIVMTDGGKFDKIPRVMTQNFLAELDKIQDPKQIGRNTPEELKKWKEAVKKEVTNFSLTHDKLEFSQFIKNFDLHFNKVVGAIGKVGNIGFTIAEKTIFWAVFFRSYGKNMQDAGMLAASLAEVGLFGVGARIGGRAPGLLALPMGLAGGIGAVVLGHHLGGKYGADKKFWTLYPEREDATKKLWGGEGNSLIGSILSGNVVHEYLDMGGVDVRFSPKGGLDINATSYNSIDFRGSPWPKDWMTKRRGLGVGDSPELLKPWTWLKEGPEIGQDTTVAEMDVLSTSINFKTHPREWMGLTVGRDVDLWNKRVEEYKVWLQKFINTILDEYRSESGIFRVENTRKIVVPEAMTRSYLADYELDKSGNPLPAYAKDVTLLKDENGKWYEPLSPLSIRELQKQIILKKRLQNALGTNDFFALKASLGFSGAGGDNDAIINNIVGETCILAKDSNKQARKKNINFLVGNYTDYLTINSDYLAAEQIKLKNQETLLLGDIERFSKEIQDSKAREYFLTLFGRILKKERLTGNTTDESRYFKELIGSEATIANMDIKVGKQLEALFSEGKAGLDKSVTVGDSFYEILEKMVAYKKQKDFLENVEKYGKGHKWSVI